MYLSQVSFMEPDVKLLYRRPQSRDKYEVMTDVLDDILIQLENIQKRLENLES